ncbi:RUN and SH3 domain-containing protein 1 isoform X3 [Seriola dumerili]|uniref:RUN and SH3 domain-containing protein 1 isoform X3 n=1 Tax=Seriola dumerili TaxID=41447 RepID=UPI000BBF343B|nr:RUN and SH3 domain-containing protein 1 isoform X3 [Seriola dumerili]
MQSSSSSSQPPKPRRFDVSRRTNTLAAPKSHGPGFQREDKNMNTITTSSPRRPTKGPAAPTRTRVGVQPRAPVNQSRFCSQKQGTTISKAAKPKPKNARASAATKIAPAAAPPPPLPSVLPLDPNCNEPSLPCLCCDGRSPQDNNSMFNHNHNNNNTISLRQQLQLPPPPAPLPQGQDGTGAKEQRQPPSQVQAQLEPSACPPASLENEDKHADESEDLDNKKNLKVEEEDDEEESSGDIDIDDDEEEADNDDDDDDDDTLVPSCCDCPPSLLEFSLSSSTSSSSTSISSCSDLESDCADQSASICSSHDQENLSVAMSPKDHSLPQAPECQPPARSPPSLPLSRNPFSLASHSPIPPCSPDEGYPSALDSPSPDYLGVKGDSEVTKLGLLDFLESVGEFGKMERFSQVIQVARWDLEGEQHWDVLRDRLDHLDRLEKVNREVKLAYIAKLHERGFDLGDLEEQDLSDVMDEMGNIDIPWKLYKNRGGTMGDSQEFSDAGVDLTAPSDCDDPLVPDSLTPSPVEPPPRPPKPPARHASVSSYLHTYINISRETTSMAVSTSPTLSTFSPNSSSPTFTTFRCEKPLPPSPPSVPPLPASKPVPYLTLYTTPSPPPAIPTPTPPIPPPRKRHLARKEAQRLAALQAEQEKTPLSLPPPTTRPPPLPPPPVISISTSPPAIPPPPALPPPPSFHALDVEIRKLLMLAGLTQAELLKLSPELGVCVGGLEDEGDGDNRLPSRSMESHEFRLQDREEEKEFDTEFVARGGCSSRGKLDGDQRVDIAEEGKTREESKDTQRTTSFTEMARRRKRNGGVTSDHYYSTGLSNTQETKAQSMSFETFHYPPELPDSPPPPPPPRPLPPIPPSLPPLKVSTLPANSAQPERFDWLIAFTPDCDAPPQPLALEMRRSHMETQKKPSSSGSSPGSAPKVTTFKELRFRNKSTCPQTKVITDPDPDPTVITPDADILYNLKWRREKAGTDGNQWEYTSQAQALFMQPPPALTSMAALKEMLKRADEEGGQPELCPSQKIGCSVSDSSLWTMGREWEGEEVKREEKEGKEEEKEEEVEVRGRADGGRTFQSRTTAVRSVSFAGSVQRGETSWMGEDVKFPMRGLGLSSLCLQEKKALVSAVSVAVEAILAQFSSSRTVVQKSLSVNKALSGDSTINPSLGRLVLQCLCPALHSLLTDGLKPHQSDLIAGRRPNSAWGLVQASTKPGPRTQALFNLQARVGELPQLRQSKHRFNAFLLGLLNTKSLDFWLSHLQSCSDVLETYYRPTSFMRLSLTTCQPLFEELLLVLQPLSLLTFNLDLLFQHHHLEPDSHSPEIPSPPCQDAGFQKSTKGSQSKITGSRYMESLSELDFGSPERQAAKEKPSTLADPKNGGSGESTQLGAAPIKASVSLGQTSPQLLWVQEKEIGELPPPDVEEDSLAQQAGQVIQQGWGAVMRWGGRFSQNLAELSLSAGKKEEMKTDLPDLQTQTGSDYTPVSSGGQVPWGFGRLFGASKSPNSPTGHTPPTRRPSQWLAPGVTALTRMVSSSSTPMMRRAAEPQGESEPESDKEVDTLEMKDKPRPLRSVRTLCDHTGAGSELSFCKGEELVVLGGVDQDWIRCRQGDKEGLVPIGYTSLII